MNAPPWGLPFSRALLVLTGGVYLGLGLAFALWPVEWAAKVGLTLDDPSSVTEIRALYGGLELGLAVFFLACGVRRAWVLPGVLGLLCTYGGLACVRGLSLLLGGVHGDLHPKLLVVELGGAVASGLALWALTRVQPEAGQPSERSAR